MRSERTWALLYLAIDTFGVILWMLLERADYLSLVVSVLVFLIVFVLFEEYREPLRRARLHHIVMTGGECSVGFLIVMLLGKTLALPYFFTLYYPDFLLSFSRLVGLILVFRFAIDTLLAYMIKTHRIKFNAIVIGSTERTASIVKYIKSLKYDFGMNFVGYAPIPGNDNVYLDALGMPRINLSEIRDYIMKYGVEEVFIDWDRKNKDLLLGIIAMLEGLKVNKYIVADEIDMVIGRSYINTPMGIPVFKVCGGELPIWYAFTKRAMDIVISIVGIVLCLPLWIIIPVLIKMDSPGSVFYTHIRIGRWGKPFKIYKFRTMYENAEKDGTPQLSSKDDPRVTPLGRVLRRLHLDELPQLFNVLKGDMSVVGPRPERPYFVQKIMEKYPYYARVHKVRPGMTSLGQVRFGYATSVDEIINRSHYDVLYVNNMNLLLDIKILILTVKRIFDEFLEMVREFRKKGG